MSRFGILCIEDNPDTRRMLTILLSKAGYDVITADDGLQGIKKAKAWRPALILVDMMMPKMSGPEVIRRLRKIPATKHIPILVLSAYHQQALIDEAMAAGADDYLIKTVLPDDITVILDKYMSIGTAVLTKRLIRMSDEETDKNKSE